MDFQKLLDIVTRVGVQLLKNGAEIYRVEESVQRIAAAYGVEETDVFAVPTTVIISLTPPGGATLTKTKRIHSRYINFDRVHRLNELSFSVVQSPLPLDAFERQLDEIVRKRDYPLRMELFAYGLVSFAFTLFFGGTYRDAACAISLGIAISLIGRTLDRFRTNAFFIHTLCSAAAATLAVFWFEVGLAAHIDKMIIGAIMALVPGVALTNSMRDIIAGDLLAGLAKLVEALLAATAIALGAGLVLTVHRMFLV